ncbi:LicD family protein [Methanobrevibacter sp.]|uniref:LicD family protein n=1 Tax=Methanobrevibacter sp. TaxID=66852 RepID=UPI00388FBC0A
MADIDLMKLEMIDTFYLEVKQICYKYFNGDINNFELNRQINRYFNSWNVSRLDVRNTGTKSNSIKLLNKDSDLNVKHPKWLDNGRSCVIEFKKNPINLNFECNGKGKFTLHIKGVDFRNSQSKRIPILIIYKKLFVDDELIFDKNTLSWHNQQYTYRQNCENDEKINIRIEFETIFDHFPKLNEYQTNIIRASKDNKNVKKVFEQFEKYILQQKFELSKTVNNETFLLNEHLELSAKFNELMIEFNNFKKDTNKILDSYNILFDSLFKYHTLEPKPVVKYSRELNNQLLDFITHVCRKYDLEWWLSFGNLIGAIRHEGSIPWDDDVDICMMRKDYDKFYEVIHEELKINNLNEHISVNINKKGPNNSLLSFMKFEYFDNNRLFGFIDIIPFDYVNSIIDDSEYIFYKEHHKFISELKKGADREELLNNFFELFDVSKTKTDIILSGIEHRTYTQVDYSDIFPLKTIKYEDRYYPSPKEGEKLLKLKYGSDFIKVPKIVHHHSFFDALSTRYDDTFETFERSIALLQKVNSRLKEEY